jgi:hypothetical protein
VVIHIKALDAWPMVAINQFKATLIHINICEACREVGRGKVVGRAGTSAIPQDAQQEPHYSIPTSE